MSRYLGRDPVSMIASIRSRAPDWFALAESVAKFCGELLPQVSANTGDGLQILSAVLFRRALSMFEAVVLAAERGMYTEGLVLRRSMLEGLFVLGAIWQQPELVRTYVQNDQHRRRNMLTCSPNFAPFITWERLPGWAWRDTADGTAWGSSNRGANADEPRCSDDARPR